MATRNKSKTLDDLFHAMLQDAHSGETQLVAALPKMAEAASSADLRAAFEKHLSETMSHVSQLEQVCSRLGIEPEGNTCEAMEGLISEGEEIVGMGLDAAAQDAGLIAAAQKVEHYEIAQYGTLCTFARQLGRDDVAATLHGILDEEKATDAALTELAEAGINADAQA